MLPTRGASTRVMPARAESTRVMSTRSGAPPLFTRCVAHATSLRRASIVGTTMSTCEAVAAGTPAAMAANPSTPTSGNDSAYASAWADAIPTRMPVKSPGPIFTAIAASSLSPRPARFTTKSIIGVTSSACLRSLRSSLAASTTSPSTTATLTTSVAVSIPSTIMIHHLLEAWQQHPGRVQQTVGLRAAPRWCRVTPP